MVFGVSVSRQGHPDGHTAWRRRAGCQCLPLLGGAPSLDMFGTRVPARPRWPRSMAADGSLADVCVADGRLWTALVGVLADVPKSNIKNSNSYYFKVCKRLPRKCSNVV